MHYIICSLTFPYRHNLYHISGYVYFTFLSSQLFFRYNCSTLFCGLLTFLLFHCVLLFFLSFLMMRCAVHVVGNRWSHTHTQMCTQLHVNFVFFVLVSCVCMCFNFSLNIVLLCLSLRVLTLSHSYGVCFSI